MLRFNNGYGKSFLAVVTSVGIFATVLPAEYANAETLNDQHVTVFEQNTEVSEAEINSLAGELEKFFENVLVDRGNGEYEVDRGALVAQYGKRTAQQVMEILEPNVSAGQPGSTRETYGECVLNFAGFGTLYGAADGSIRGYLQGRQWKKAAKEIVKLAGRQAVRGGIIGLAASLAAGGAWCARPWR